MEGTIAVWSYSYYHTKEYSDSQAGQLQLDVGPTPTAPRKALQTHLDVNHLQSFKDEEQVDPYRCKQVQIVRDECEGNKDN